MIRYSLSGHNADPRNPEAGKKVYARAQITEKMSMEKFAEHISEHNSKYNVADVMAVIVTMVCCLREQLLAGKKVELGYLGEFYVNLRSTGAEDEAMFSENENIKDVVVNWERGDKFCNMRDDATFEYSMTRAQQRAAKKAAKLEVHDSIYDEGDDIMDDDDTMTDTGSDSSSGTGNTGSNTSEPDTDGDDTGGRD